MAEPNTSELEALGGAGGTPDDLAQTALPEPAAVEKQTQRYAKTRQHSILNAAVDIAGDDDYEALAPGTRFMGPDRKPRVKPYAVTSDEDYDEVPEGAQFVDPDGKTRQKPASESISYSAETLYRMATTPTAREQALKMFYGDKVKRDTKGEFYIEDEGKTLRPGRGVTGFTGNLTAEAAPMTGMLVGGQIGALSTVETGPGVVLGAAGGAMAGAVAGRQFNNFILGLAGIHQTLGEQFKSVVDEAGGVALGEGAGRLISKVPAALAATSKKTGGVRDSLGNLRENLPQVLEQIGITPERARKFLGTPLATAERASDISSNVVEVPGRGQTNVMVPPSVYAPEAPMLKKIEEFDRVFRSQDVVAQSWEAFYNKQSAQTLEELGVHLGEPATRATKKVSSERAGQLALSAAQKDMAQADALLENARRDAIGLARRPVDQLGGEEAAAKFQTDALARLQAAHQRAQEVATGYVQAAAKDLREDIDLSIKMAANGDDTSDLNRAIAAKFQGWNVTIRQRAKTMYDAANDAAGGARIDIGSLSEEAAAFLKSVPEQVRQKYPSEIANLSRIAQAAEQEGGQFQATGIDIVGEAGGAAAPADSSMSFGELHQLRSWFRYGIDYQDMTPDMKQGSLKLFEKKINGLLREGQTPELKTASGLLDQADAFYRQNVPFLSDQMVQGTVDMLKSGEGANPEALAKMLFDPERTSAMRRVRGIVGENLWKGVQAADTRHMLDASRIIGSNEIDGAKFAQQVEQRLKDGLLETAYDSRTAARLQKIATDTRKLAGQLPITSEPGDTVSTLMRRVEIARQEADKFAELDPLKALKQATSEIDTRANKAQEAARKTRRQEPLHHLYEESQSHLAVRAADKILASQDLIMAAATQFGRDSGEFNALRQVYVARFMQRAFPKTAAMRAELGGEKGMTEEVQALMFPGITRDQMVTLAKNMEFLFQAGGTDIGGSLAAASRVLHPEANFPIQTKALKLLMNVPGASSAARYTLGKFYALAMDATTHPNFINWLANRLEGDAFARAQARAAIQQRIKMGQLLGRGFGQQALGSQQSNKQEQPETVQ